MLELLLLVSVDELVVVVDLLELLLLVSVDELVLVLLSADELVLVLLSVDELLLDELELLEELELVVVDELTTQALATHTPLAQVLPQVPQFFGSSAVLAHPDGQSVSPVGHMAMHAFPLQPTDPPAGADGQVVHVLSQMVSPEGQVGTHAWLVTLQVSDPPVGSDGQVAQRVPQSRVPATPHVQVPAVQVPPGMHWLPQLPQFFGSVAVSDSHPFDATPSQFPYPAAHPLAGTVHE